MRNISVSMWVAICYIVALHVFVIILIVKTNFIPKILVKLGVSDISDFNPHYQNMIRIHLSMDSAVPPKAVIFLGDSITQGLATSAVSAYSVNYGIDGETTTQLIKAIPLYKSIERADTIVLMIGVNDLIQGAKGGLVDRYRQIIHALPPDVALICNTIMPVADTYINPKEIIEINRGIGKICEARKNTILIDTWSLFADSDEKIIQNYFLGDGLHLSPDGYARWITALRKALQ